MPSISIKYRKNIENVRDALIKSIEECGFSIRESVGNSIKASTSSSILSWGEDLEVILSKKRDEVEITVTSTPTAQIFDWGKSDENIRRIIEKIDQKLKD